MPDFATKAKALKNIANRAELAGYFPVPNPAGLALQHQRGVRVIVTIEEHDSKNWVHVSCSRSDRLPDWEDIMFVKDTTVGRDAEAYQVLPAKSKHVNLHPNVLHMWHCLDGNALPDFRNALGLI